MTANDARQPTAAPSRVPSGTPATVATVAPAATTATARASRSGGTSRAAYGVTTAQNTPCAAPPTTRATTSTA